MKPLIEELHIDKNAFRVYNNISRSPYSFFLDSSMDPANLGRFSFIGDEPFLIFSSNRGTINVDCQGWKKTFNGNPLYILRELLARYTQDYSTGLFPFWGGAVGWFSYDLKDFIEKLPNTSRDDLDISDCRLGFYDCVLIFDNLKEKAYISSTGFPETGRKRILRAKAKIETVKNRLKYLDEDTVPRHEGLGPFSGELESNFSKEQYIEAVLKAKEYIEKGDIYQVNLSQRFYAETRAEPFDIYKVLREINPAPFAAYLNFDDVQVMSASPERYMRIDGRRIQTRPIKGTRPRGRDIKEEMRLKRDLTSSVKDRAENLMIVDLERNDLGRICEYGSIEVKEFMKCETFPTVFHLTSGIEGRLRNDIDAVDVLLNCFPGGSITGAPKIRSMEIIDELEGLRRSIYTGAIGYIGFNGGMDTSVVIRTLIHKKGKLYFNVGGGIVYDSVPEREYEETIYKGRALMEAIGCRGTWQPSSLYRSGNSK